MVPDWATIVFDPVVYILGYIVYYHHDKLLEGKINKIRMKKPPPFSGLAPPATFRTGLSPAELRYHH